MKNFDKNLAVLKKASGKFIVPLREWIIKCKGDKNCLSNILTIFMFGLMLYQTGLLQNQIFVANALAISELGERCLWNTLHGGNYNSYQTLEQLKDHPDNKELKEYVKNELRRVHDMYKSELRDYSIENTFTICKQHVNCTEKEPENGFSAANVLNHAYRHLWTERARAVYLLRNITSEQLKSDHKKWEDVFKALLDVMADSEWSLAARKTALDSYSKLTGFDFKEDIFNFQAAIKHWEDNKEEILKKQEEGLK